MSKVIIISDLHGDASTAGVERIGDVEEALNLVVTHAHVVGAESIICLGDLCDPDSPGLLRCIAMARSAAQRFPNSLWLAGNHDVLEDGWGTTTLDLVGEDVSEAESASGALVCTKPTVCCTGRVQVACLPYTALSHTYDPVKKLRELHSTFVNPQNVQLVIGHLMLEGISMGSETEDFPRGRDVFFPIDEAKRLFPNAVLLNGHYHDRQTYRGVEVPGALVRLTRADAGRQPCFLEIEV